MNDSTNLTMASHQWATRPKDQRFLTLADLKKSVGERKAQSWTTPQKASEMVIVAQADDVGVQVQDHTSGEFRTLTPSNWAFAQLAGYAGAPASFLRTLPPEIMAIPLQWKLDHAPLRESGLVLAQTNGSNMLRALTSESYGRIWDIQVVEQVERINEQGNWKVPLASYSDSNPLRATTLYASDRDVFIFLVDPDHAIDIKENGGKPLYRGFYVWNSEVGSAVFGMTTFLYNTVCDNRIIWGATDVREFRIKHTGGAPDRFFSEAAGYLERFSNESIAKLQEGIAAAQAKKIPVTEGETVQQWLQRRKFTESLAKLAVDFAEAEQGKAETIWDIVQGASAAARKVEHTDVRVQIEKQAGALMELAVK